MDGVNTLTIGYYFLVLLFISKIFLDLNNSILTIEFIYISLFSLILLFILNCFNALYLGDNGAYLISFFVGIFLIHIANNNILISPFYIVNLLWYPAYENFFSIIRKIKNKKSALNPDNFHLHQLIFKTLNKKIENSKITNSLTGIIINSFNCLIFFLATQHYSNTKYQLSLIFLPLLIYNVLYIILKTNLKKI